MMMAYFDVSPIPNHSIANGTTATGEIGRTSSRSGSVNSAMMALRPIKVPAKMPTMQPTT